MMKQGKPLKYRLNVPTLVSDVNQTLSSMGTEVNALKKTIKGVQTLASATSGRVSTLTTVTAVAAPISGKTTYSVGQQVTSGGNVYQCIAASAGTPPPNINYWQLIGPATLDSVLDGPIHGKTLVTALTAGSVDLTKAGVLMRGCVPPALNPAFTYTSTATTITWSWGANTAVYRADGTVTVIGAGSQAITGLTASTMYNFYPIYDETLGTLRFITTTDISTPSLFGYTGNGTSGYVETTTSLSSPGSFSAEMWVEVAGAPGGFVPLLSLTAPQGTGSGNQVFSIQLPGSLDLTVYIKPTSGSSSTSSVIAAGIVHHIVFTWNNTTFVGELYVDGVLVSTLTGAAALTSYTGLYWHIGAAYGSNIGDGAQEVYSPSNAWLSNVAIYSSVLTAAQVLATYSAGLNLGQSALASSVATNGAIYYWKLQETSGTTAADSAGSNTGTYVGGVTLHGSEATHSAVGSPAIAWTQNTFLAGQAQILQSRIALSMGPMQVTTPASGSGTPGGGGGRPPGGIQAY